MKTIVDLYEYAYHVWYCNIPHAAFSFITDIDKTGERMAYLAADMILRGHYM